MTDTPTVAIIGGRVAGLAAAERFASFADSVTIYERDDRIGDPVNCGEGVTSPELIPVAKTPANGFVNECPNFIVRVQPAASWGWSGERLTETRLSCDPAFITDRGVMERAWADRLRDCGVEIRTGDAVSTRDLDALREATDVVVDASGSPSVTMQAYDAGGEYGEDMVALNADVTGDFSEFYPEAYVIFEGYEGYFWVFPKSPERANVGIGWMTSFAREHSLHYREELAAACDRHDVPVPRDDKVSVYTIPSGPALAKTWLRWPGSDRADVYLVGDAAGLANRYQGEGITQAIESAYVLAALVDRGAGHRYPDVLWEQMLPEFRLAHLMKGAWDEHRDPGLIAAITAAIRGLTLEETTREPRTVYRRLARHPVTSMRLLANRGMLRRLYEGYTDSWEIARA